MSSYKSTILGILVLCSLIPLSWAFSKYYFDSKPISTFVEVKVIDDKGHPVAGAKVFQKKEYLGLTDAFGTWKEFVKIFPEEKLVLRVQKKKGKKTFSNKKEIFLKPEELIKEKRLSYNILIRTSHD